MYEFLLIIFVVSMFLWFLSALPWPPFQQYNAGAWILAFIAVLILGIIVFTGGGGHVSLR